MSDAAIFSLVFGGLLVLRIIAATVVFILILPHGDRCPMCDAMTLRVHAPALSLFRLPLAKRWCIACGWQGIMQRASAKPMTHVDPGAARGASTIEQDLSPPTRRSQR
ncbi:MAG: hypothetical protein ACT4P6_05705 [Gemmatimonadaceae bacterium]